MDEGNPQLPDDPKDFYVVTPKVTVREVAEVYQRAFPGKRGLSRKNLERRCTGEDWPALRRRHEERTSDRLSKHVAESHARTRARHVTQYRRVQNLGKRIIGGLEARLSIAEEAAGPVPDGLTAEEQRDVKRLRLARAVATLSKDDFDALRSASVALDASSRGERELVGERDDRITRLLEGAGQIADAQEPVVDYDPEVELLALAEPTVKIEPREKSGSTGGDVR